MGVPPEPTERRPSFLREHCFTTEGPARAGCRLEAGDPAYRFSVGLTLSHAKHVDPGGGARRKRVDQFEAAKNSSILHVLG